MFSSGNQAATAIGIMLTRVNMRSVGELWTTAGPTPRAIDLMDHGGEALSPDEIVLLRVAFDRKGGARVKSIVDALDVARTTLVFSLILAVQGGAEAVQTWI